ncbi:alpha/beta fold hydrolase [Gaetbulibacter aestuarii]|uniref:Alpha/beta hydrolase n=1 Tax=Gaetbulibacter aestuarii TaxID=1502358 RepID=A0ABW7MX76_9FLAO
MTKTITIELGGLTFDCLAAGNEKDPLILFLHGFPETAFMWKNLIEDFSKKGFYGVAPNQRGYSKGACPNGKKNYRLNLLVEDIIGISKALNKHKFHLVGHDWGAVVGWKVTHDHPDKVLSWSALSVPHIQAFGNAMMTNPEQKKMSQYVKNFQIPFLPEMRIMKKDLALFKRLWKYSSEEEVADYLSVFRNRKQLTAALNYYRANYRMLKQAAKQQILGPIKVPTLFIWGNKDIAIGRAGVEASHKFMKGPYEFLELDAGHWLIQTNYKDLKNVLFSLIKHEEEKSS